jgi:hypothetical protein
MFCNRCGAVLNDTVKFCGSCGASVGTTSNLPRTCTCGVELNPAMKFCVSCGRPSSASQSLPQPFQQPQQVIQQPYPRPVQQPYSQPASQQLNTLATPNALTSNSGQTINEIKEQSSTGQKISLSAALVGVICFFLPWIEVSCVGMRKSASGLQLATDMEITEVWLVLLVFLAAVGLILFQILAKTMSKDKDKLLNSGVIGAGIVPLLIMFYEYIRFSNEITKVKNSTPFGMGQILGGAIENSISYQFGGILSVIVSIVVAIGGALHLLDKRARNRSG